jgi:hypothetical protein
MGGPGSGRKPGIRNGMKKISTMTDFSIGNKIAWKGTTIGRKSNKALVQGKPTRVSKAALERRVKQYGPALASKMKPYNGQ